MALGDRRIAEFHLKRLYVVLGRIAGKAEKEAMKKGEDDPVVDACADAQMDVLDLQAILDGEDRQADWVPECWGPGGTVRDDCSR